jgi:hypothetical protein
VDYHSDLPDAITLKFRHNRKNATRTYQDVDNRWHFVPGNF